MRLWADPCRESVAHLLVTALAARRTVLQQHDCCNASPDTMAATSACLSLRVCVRAGGAGERVCGCAHEWCTYCYPLRLSLARVHPHARTPACVAIR